MKVMIDMVRILLCDFRVSFVMPHVKCFHMRGAVSDPTSSMLGDDEQLTSYSTASLICVAHFMNVYRTVDLYPTYIYYSK